MRHKSVAIQISDLQNRVMTDSDNFDLSDALGIEIAAPANDEDWDRYSAELVRWVESHRAEFAIVTWPEHVVNPRFNSDANYVLVGSRNQAIDEHPEAVFYGE